MNLGLVLGIVIIVALIAFISYKSKGKLSELSVPSFLDGWKDEAKRASIRYGIPVPVILAIIWQESHGKAGAVGSSGEQGLMQLKKIAIKDVRKFGLGNFPNWNTSPKQNVLAGTAFLKLQLRRTEGELARALSEFKRKKSYALEAYNEGYAQSKKDLGSDKYAKEVIKKMKKIKHE